MSLDKGNLSKIKHIYRIYTSQDKKIHCERYPVVYINETYVYYVQSKRSILEYVSLTSLREVFTGSLSDLEPIGHFGMNRYFTKVENFDAEKLEKEIFGYKKSEKRKNLESRVEQTRSAYEQACEKLRVFEANNPRGIEELE